MNNSSLKKKYTLLILSGVFIGLLNGFFGGGGGMVCVPILEAVLGLDNKYAHATSIAIILPLSLVSSFIYTFNGGIDLMKLLYVGLGVIIGGGLGALLLKRIHSKIIRIIFAILMLAGGIKMVI